jgi:hypothetical protein
MLSLALGCAECNSINFGAASSSRFSAAQRQDGLSGG